MRTKNRPVLLKRALESVLFQSYEAWELIVVNDGGDPEPIERLVSHFAFAARERIRVLHNATSLGMAGASAAGLAATRGDLIVIHDDDDSWAPEFLAVAVSELQRAQRDEAAVQGVTSYCNQVFERVRGQTIEIDSVNAFNGWLKPGFLSLDRMLVGNVLPPISFLFTREAFVALGSIYEVIPYLGDWDFMIRFLVAYDIVVVPQYLAFYHWRTADSAFGNSVTAEVDRHHFYRQLLLNRWLRADLASGRFGIGSYANFREHVEEIKARGDALQDQLRIIKRTQDQRPALAQTQHATAAAEIVEERGRTVTPKPSSVWNRLRRRLFMKSNVSDDSLT